MESATERAGDRFDSHRHGKVRKDELLACENEEALPADGVRAATEPEDVDDWSVHPTDGTFHMPGFAFFDLLFLVITLGLGVLHTSEA